MDERPDLDAHFDIFGVEATVTIPGGDPDPIVVVTRVAEIGPFVERFPSDSGNWSMTKMRRRFRLRLSELGDLPGSIFGMTIAMATETVTVDAVDYRDNEVIDVLTR